MQLIGMLDSPYVRRTAIALAGMGIAFEHAPLSVFRTYDAFAAINPVVKAPSLVADDGTVLMDSGLIIAYGRRLAGDGALGPTDPTKAAVDLRLTGLALVACEKAVQIVYERNLRPAEKQHQPWLDRVAGQLAAAAALIDGDVASAGGWLMAARPCEAGISLAVAGTFIRNMVADVLRLEDYPAFAAHTDAAEASDAFRAYPFA